MWPTYGRFVMNSHVKSRTIYLTRHGETLFNKNKLIGGDSVCGRDASACLAIACWFRL